MPASPVPPDLHARLVAALADARRAAKLRQVDLAERLGWQQAYVSRYETGERMLGVDEYVTVALAIGIDPVALLGDVLTEYGRCSAIRLDLSRVQPRQACDDRRLHAVRRT